MPAELEGGACYWCWPQGRPLPQERGSRSSRARTAQTAPQGEGTLHWLEGRMDLEPKSGTLHCLEGRPEGIKAIK